MEWDTLVRILIALCMGAGLIKWLQETARNIMRIKNRNHDGTFPERDKSLLDTLLLHVYLAGLVLCLFHPSWCIFFGGLIHMIIVIGFTLISNKSILDMIDKDNVCKDNTTLVHGTVISCIIAWAVIILTIILVIVL